MHLGRPQLVCEGSPSAAASIGLAQKASAERASLFANSVWQAVWQSRLGRQIRGRQKPKYHGAPGEDFLAVATTHAGSARLSARQHSFSLVLTPYAAPPRLQYKAVLTPVHLTAA